MPVNNYLKVLKRQKLQRAQIAVEYLVVTGFVLMIVTMIFTYSL